MANIKRNLMYSTVLTMSTYLVPLIVFPYISRILGVGGIGIVDTVDNMIDYCILFSMMGLSSVGVREIAKNKYNPKALSQTFTDLFALNLCSTLLIATVFCGVVLMSPRLQDYGLLIPIGILKLVANLFWIEWLYTGLEDFRYITLRSIILRSAFIVSVFLFVQTQADVVTYYALFVGITVGNAVCNWYHKRSYLHWDIRQANIRRFLVPFFMLGIFAMLSAVYSKLSLPVLNFLTDNQEAGNFATATRVYRVVIALISTLTGVMIPRMSVLISRVPSCPCASQCSNCWSSAPRRLSFSNCSSPFARIAPSSRQASQESLSGHRSHSSLYPICRVSAPVWCGWQLRVSYSSSPLWNRAVRCPSVSPSVCCYSQCSGPSPIS